MSVALIWGSPGCGKTVAATAPAEEKIKLLLQSHFASNSEKADFSVQKNTEFKNPHSQSFNTPSTLMKAEQH